MWRASSLALLLLAACERPRPLVICHNVNCVRSDASRDDTPAALDASLALRFAGRPVLDGIELDTLWHGAASRCLLAHDLDGETSALAGEAAGAIAAYLRDSARASWNGERFHVFIELKSHVGREYSDVHSPAERDLHAECALDVMDTIAAGAHVGGHAVTFAFSSGAPALLEALIGRPRWAAARAQGRTPLLVGDIFAPYDAIVPRLDEYRIPLDAMEYHPDFLNDGQVEAYRSLGLELVQWSFTMSVEAFAAIERHRPRYVLTNEAELLRRWIER